MAKNIAGSKMMCRDGGAGNPDGWLLRGAAGIGPASPSAPGTGGRRAGRGGPGRWSPASVFLQSVARQDAGHRRCHPQGGGGAGSLPGTAPHRAGRRHALWLQPHLRGRRLQDPPGRLLQLREHPAPQLCRCLPHRAPRRLPHRDRRCLRLLLPQQLLRG